MPPIFSRVTNQYECRGLSIIIQTLCSNFLTLTTLGGRSFAHTGPLCIYWHSAFYNWKCKWILSWNQYVCVIWQRTIGILKVHFSVRYFVQIFLQHQLPRKSTETASPRFMDYLKQEITPCYDLPFHQYTLQVIPVFVSHCSWKHPFLKVLIAWHQTPWVHETTLLHEQTHRLAHLIDFMTHTAPPSSRRDPTSSSWSGRGLWDMHGISSKWYAGTMGASAFPLGFNRGRSRVVEKKGPASKRRVVEGAMHDGRGHRQVRSGRHRWRISPASQT